MRDAFYAEHSILGDTDLDFTLISSFLSTRASMEHYDIIGILDG